ncbi:cytochrome P450 [Actinomadura rubrisoli]|uniref:Cytochrome P450 n=1 Tax=Actinomadura rubrisoli TaxID=2530368 RepID=A0A4R5CAA5_9ACTN|nr:cytochrome P450 [Actinomadura rubrisoli]TDD95120.1 cytochrome P450 [Actinomadura rubrisoli]
MTSTESILTLFSPSGRSNPYPSYKDLRESDPIYMVGSHRGIVTGYPESVEIIRNPRIFAVPDRAYADRTWPGWREHPSVVTIYGSLMYQNPPDNQPARRLLVRFFDRRRIQAVQATIERLAEEYAAALAPQDATDVVDATEKFIRLPDAVMGEMSGLSRQEMDRLAGWLDSVLRANEFNPPGNDLAEADLDVPKILAFFDDLLNSGRTRPDGLIDYLRPHWASEDRQSLLDLLAFVFGAGTVTTVSLLGSGLVELSRHPHLLDAIKDNRELLRSFVWEVVRYDPPVQYGTRIALEDTIVQGVPIPQDAMLLVCFGAIGRDARQFPDPETFRADRFLEGKTDPKEVMSFGLGTHHCVGAELALATATAAFHEVAMRFGSLRLASEPIRADRVVVRNFERLEVRAESRTAVTRA